MKIGIAGIGNLGRSLLEGLLRSGISPLDILICEVAERVNEISEKFGVAATDDINELIDGSDTVFLALKSYVFEESAKIIRLPISPEKTIVSFMAGVGFEKLHGWLGDCNAVLAMPSVAIAANDGVIGYTEAPAEIVGIFNKLGYAIKCEPEQLLGIMAFASCGLGFAAHLMDAFAKMGESFGFSKDEAGKIAAITFRNAVDRGDFEATVKTVATRGGATEQGIIHLDEAGVADIITEAARRAYDKMK